MGLFGEFWMFNLLVLFMSIFGLIVWLLKRQYTYWERKGIKSYPNPRLLVGHFGPAFAQKEFIGELIARLYKNSKEPFVGIYGFLWPFLLVRDPELIRSILIKDFPSFTDRGVYFDEVNDPVSAHIASLRGQRWKHLRAKLSPAFTSGKLKAMFSTLVDCGSSLQNHLEKLCDSGELLDIREIAGCYSTDITASVAFGIDVDSIKNPNNEFRVCSRKLFEPSIWNGFRLILNFFVPQLMPLLRIKSIDASVEKFVLSMVKQNLEYREKNNVSRKDLFQLLIQLRNSGTVEEDGEWNTVIKGDQSQKSLSITDIAAQVVAFFEGGFETSATTMTYCLFELTKNPEIHARLVEEMDRVLRQHDGKITFESISEMKYLEACMYGNSNYETYFNSNQKQQRALRPFGLASHILETLRKYPVAVILNRKCVKDYKIPGTDKVIEKGVDIFIPVYGLHRDENYYPEPEKFKPERFLDGSSDGKLYLSFGDGPRNCIAGRLGKIQIQVGLIFLLQKFKYELKSKPDAEFSTKHFLLSPKYPIKLRVLRR